MPFKLEFEHRSGPTWSEAVKLMTEKLGRKITNAVQYAMGMWLKETGDDISSNLGPTWTDTLRLEVRGNSALENMSFHMMTDEYKARVIRSYNEGAIIEGKPLMWIPISGTDAAGIRARDFGPGLFSAKYPRRDGGPPLLFGRADKQPKYFGIESVTRSKRLHLEDERDSALERMRAAFREGD